MKKAATLSILLAFVASSVGLLLLESLLKPTLYFFRAALILTGYHSLSGNLENKVMAFSKTVGIKN